MKLYLLISYLYLKFPLHLGNGYKFMANNQVNRSQTIMQKLCSLFTLLILQMNYYNVLLIVGEMKFLVTITQWIEKIWFVNLFKERDLKYVSFKVCGTNNYILNFHISSLGSHSSYRYESPNTLPTWGGGIYYYYFSILFSFDLFCRNVFVDLDVFVMLMKIKRWGSLSPQFTAL